MRFKYLNHIFTITLFLLVSKVSGIEGAWSSEYLGPKNPIASKSLNDPAFQRLKKQVFEYIKGGWCTDEKAEIIMDCVVCSQPKTCVEIGSFTGSTTLPMLAALKYLGSGHAYLIDAWSNQEAIKGLDNDDPNTAWWSTLNMQAVKNQLLHMLSNWGLNSYSTVIHSSSSQACSRVNSIDFLHLDGNFSEQGALLDVQLYLPKVNSGGYILISNVLVMIGGKPPKVKSLWPLFEECEIIGETKNSNAILFRKK